MKKILVLVSLGILIPAFALAAGSGGGGGGGGSSGSSLCTDDTYSCTDWGNCENSARTRRCVLSIDCANVDTPKPVEQQTCGAACTADTWTCGDWSGCSTDLFKETRQCTKTFDCQGVETASPISEIQCNPPAPAPAPTLPAELRCGNFATITARVRCRLRLTEEELDKELYIQYLPEECRALSVFKQPICIGRYQALKPCWEQPVGASRAACAAGVLGIRGSVAAEYKRCSIKPQAQRQACRLVVKDLAYALIKFRFYDLSERAEDTLEKGVALNTVASLVTTMELTKQDFNKATTYSQRRALILRARAAWKKFVANNKGAEKITDYLDGALKDLQTVR